MMNSSRTKETIALKTIKLLLKRLKYFFLDPFVESDALFRTLFSKNIAKSKRGPLVKNQLFPTVNSWITALPPSLGQDYIKKVTHALSGGESREYTTAQLGKLNITQKQAINISNIIADLENQTQQPDSKRENNMLLVQDDSSKTEIENFSTDIYIEESDHIIAIDLMYYPIKQGEAKYKKQTLLIKKAALAAKHPNKELQYYIGFPLSTSGNSKELHQYFAPEEVLTDKEFWNFISGQENTTTELLDIINTIATPHFISKFNYIRNSANRKHIAYSDTLKKWGLTSELELVNNDAVIREKAKEAGKTQLYNKLPYDSDGEYDWDRYYKLSSLSKK